MSARDIATRDGHGHDKRAGCEDVWQDAVIAEREGYNDGRRESCDASARGVATDDGKAATRAREVS